MGRAKNPEKCSAMGFTVVDVRPEKNRVGSYGGKSVARWDLLSWTCSKPEKNRVGSYGGHQRYVDAT